MPTTVHFNYPPYWLWNKGTGELEGFFVDLLQEMFGSMELNYTLENKIDDDMNGHAKDYGVLGKISTEKYAFYVACSCKQHLLSSSRTG